VSFILDVSITAAWAFSDETNPDADFALGLLSSDQALVPTLWWFEIRNVMIVNERRGRLTGIKTTLFLQKLARLPITVEPLAEGQETMNLARQHNLTVYDAAYLELAKRTGSALATLDQELGRAALREGISLIQAKIAPKRPAGR
jgi:predicted nucleic acid-binding protein